MRDENAEDKNRGGWEFEAWGAGFAQDGPLDRLAPGPVLAAAVIASAEDGGELAGLSDEALLGAVRGVQKLDALLGWARRRYEQEYTRRHLAWDPAAGQEMLDESALADHAQELLISGTAASGRLHGSARAARLTECMRLLHDGELRDDWRMTIIEQVTECVADELIGEVDTKIAGRAAGLTPGQLRALCRRVVMAVDPQALAERKRRARKTRRVEIRQEESGNGQIALRETPVTDAMRVKANLDRLARDLRKGGTSGSLDNLRHDAAIALLTGNRPGAGMTAATAGTPGSADAAGAGGDGPWAGVEPWDPDPAEAAEDTCAGEYSPWDFPADEEPSQDDEPGDGHDGDDSDGHGDAGPRGGGNGGGSAAETAPLALINLLVPAGTMFGLSQAPADLAGFGLMDAADTQRLVAAASRNPATRFCVTITGTDGSAVAHACVRGPRPWTPPASGPPATGPPSMAQRAAAMIGFLRSLNLRFTPIARKAGETGRCEPQHDPSRALSHLVKARNATCTAPGCGAAAVTADLDHQIPYESGGQTSEENLNPRCRHDHRLKQNRDWTVITIRPGTTRWTGPSGRSRIVHPTRYLT